MEDFNNFRAADFLVLGSKFMVYEQNPFNFLRMQEQPSYVQHQIALSMPSWQLIEDKFITFMKSLEDYLSCSDLSIGWIWSYNTDRVFD